MTDKTLTVRLKMNTSQAENSIKNLYEQINKLNRSLNSKSGASFGQKQLTNQVKLTNLQYKRSNSLLDSMARKIRTIAALYLGVMGFRAMIDVADTMIGSQNKLNYSNAKLSGDDLSDGYSASTLKATQAAMDKMYVSSQKVRMSYTDMMSNVSKFMTLAPNAFQGNVDNAIRFQEIMAEAYAVGGASAAEMSSSMYQLTQALGAGVLAGDELRSVREGAPLAYQKIEEFAKGVYNTTDSLKELASQGKITSDIVVAAIMNSGNELDMAFSQTAQTFGQTWTQVVNAAKKAFEPLVMMLKEKLNEAIDNGLITKVESFFVEVSRLLQVTFKLVEKGIQWIVSNWSWLESIVISGLITMGSVLAAQTAKAIVLFLVQNWAMMLIVTCIFAIVYALYLWQSGALSTTDMILVCLAAITLALLVLAIVMNATWLVWVAAIVIIVAYLFWFLEYVSYVLAFIVAIVLDVLSFIWNIVVYVLQAILTAVVFIIACISDVIILLINVVVTVINIILQIVWTVVDPIISIVEFILNICMGGFDNFGDGVANLIGNIIGWFLSLGKVVTTIIDAIFGTDWTGGLNSLHDKVLSWGKNENAITLSREAPTINYAEYLNPVKNAGTTWNTVGKLHTGYADPLNWGDAAFDWGSGVKDSVNNWGSGLASGLNGLLNGLGTGNWLNNLAQKLGLNITGLPDPNDPANQVGGAYTQPDDLLKDIANDTGSIKDSMELTEDDLEYLRKIASMEWKKEFTTANITVDMSNYNTISGDNDLDGIVTKLSDKLREELNTVANGVYA